MQMPFDEHQPHGISQEFYSSYDDKLIFQSVKYKNPGEIRQSYVEWQTV